MIFPNRLAIINLNRRHIILSGGTWNGPENLINPGTLEWALDAIQYPLFDLQLYPSMAEKAAILAWSIIDGHVFYDGCKRTGMSVIEVFLLTNGYGLDAQGAEIIDLAKKIAKRVEEPYSLVEFTGWLRSRIQPLNAPSFSYTIP
ncbi:MAG: type II toxin-antitoxin system death-on-curing family toxin [Chloroflexi bacterium]|nr:type II toxin-antitoxin system death-on-curing family toxin [Chloroflexota bacterium]